MKPYRNVHQVLMAELRSAKRSETMIEVERSQCAILPLVLKGKWFDMIASGEKREEYRLATEYWQLRFFNWSASVTARKPPVVEFRRGYAKNAPRMAFWCIGLETPGGLSPYAFVSFDDKYKKRHPEWGEPDNSHFVIVLGGRVTIGSTTQKSTKRRRDGEALSPIPAG